MENNKKGSQETQGKNSPSLGVISKDQSFVERRHLPRLCLSSEQLRLIRADKLFSVMDLSANGMGLLLLEPEDVQHFVVGSILEGILNLKRQKYPIQVQVRNITHERVGCEFHALEDNVKDAIYSFLDPSALGAEMKPIPSPERHVLWYHGPSGTDLLLKRLTDGHFNRITLYVLGSFIQWDETEGLVTGRTSPTADKSELRGVVRLETLIIHLDPNPDPGKLSIAKKVILSSNLPQDLKNWSIRQFEQ